MMKIDGNVFLCVCHRQVGGTCHRALKHCHFHHDLLGAVLSNAAKEEILKQNERMICCVYSAITEANCFFASITAQLILGSSLKWIIQPT